MSELVIVSRDGAVGILRLNRPRALNALSTGLLEELHKGLLSLAEDEAIAAIVITGSDKIFCAGADIKELKNLSFVTAFMRDFLRAFAEKVQAVRKPIIAAVNGYALGGGFELAMLCDTIYAGTSAVFGQPEIKIGTIPGGGGTQRLTRAIGKAKAMDLILTGKTISADEAYGWGLIARVVPDAEVFDTAIASAKLMASYSQPVVLMAKEAINSAEEMTLSQGLLFERRLYHATFGLEDTKEGMQAFIEKRAPAFNHK